MLFPAIHDAQSAIIQRINSESVRIDVATWYLAEHSISIALVNRFRAGVPVRVIGDWLPVFQIDPNTRLEFEFLASAGIPIRLRYNPTWFPEAMHWKAGIFVGQNVVEFGSANWTTFELTPFSATNFKDETTMFTNDPALVRSFMTEFDRMWVDTTAFLDFPEVYRLTNGVNWPTPMNIPRGRQVDDFPSPPGMIWGQGPELNNAMAAEIDAEPTEVDMVIYRLSDPVIRDAAIRRLRAGVPVRIMLEPSQYRTASYPEYWLTGAMIDQLWVAGARIRQRVHQGLTHMKTIVTSRVALNGSSNFTRNWQRDHNYFINVATKPALYFAIRDRFNAMWNDSVNYTGFQPLPPAPAPLLAPATGAGNVTTAARLEWAGTPWAVAFDVYIGTSPAALALAGRVNAVLSEDPPATYSFTPAQPLAPNTTYFWRVVSRTFATDVNPGLIANSELWAFSTGTSTTPPPPTSQPPPASVPPPPGPDAPAPPPASAPPPTAAAPPPAATTCTTPAPASNWTCFSGNWLPPGFPIPGGAPASPAPSAPPSSSAACPSVMPGPGWTCFNGNWLPPGFPIPGGAASAPAPAAPAPSTPVPCTTIMPGPGWSCVNGGWLPPGFPISPGLPSALPGPSPTPGGCTIPDPFVTIGGGVCVSGGGWIPRGMVR